MAKPKVETSELDEAAARIRYARGELMRLRAELVRCTSAASVGAEHSEALERLREQRRQVLAEAYADGGPPGTSEVDEAIHHHEQAHAQAIEAAAIALDAAVVLQARIEAQQDLLEQLTAEWRAEAQQALLQAFDAAEERFACALDVFAGPVAELTALAKVWRDVTGKPIPADGRDGLLEGLRSVAALRVVWTHSALRHREVAARFAPQSYQGAARFAPEWLTDENFGACEIGTLREQLHVDEVQASQ
ncbi:hypothetical protein [Paraburkholderia sp. BR10954]|uniref:hypothetical protein n=1 Tax=Paraburkholderia sp. BR10954 TaxID=3236995 RepID=UPI0034D35D7E